MKKTIIALIALCGVSMGANLTTAQLVSTIGDKLDALGYEAGDSFTITFTLAENGWNGANYAGILGLGTPFGGESDDYLRLETTSSGLSGAIIGMAVDGASIGSGTPVVGVEMQQEPREHVVAESNATHYNRDFLSPGLRLSVYAEASPGQAAVAGCHPLTSFGVRVIFSLSRGSAALPLHHLPDSWRPFTGLKSGGYPPAGLMLHIPIFLNLWDTCDFC